jgi:hypothetical protein
MRDVHEPENERRPDRLRGILDRSLHDS